MYPSNPQYYSSQQLGQNSQQYLASSYLQSHQHPQHASQAYTATMQNTTLQQLQQQQQQAAAQNNSNYTQQLNSLQAASTHRALTKPANSHLADQMRSTYDVARSQNKNVHWLPSRSMSLPHPASAAQPWLLAQDIRVEQSSNTLHDMLSSQRIISQSAMSPHNHLTSQCPVIPRTPLAPNVQAAQPTNRPMSMPQATNQPLSPNQGWASGRMQPHSRQASAQPSGNRGISHSLSPRNTSSIPQGPNNLMRSPIHLLSPDPPTSILGISMQTAAQQKQMAIHNAKTIASQQEKRNKIHITFDQKSMQSTQPQPQVNRSTSRASVDTSSSREDEVEREVKTPLVFQDNTRIVIDDDIEIVGCKEAEVMSHIRSDCPIHAYTRVDNVELPPDTLNTKRCSKCFCYICDKLAVECGQWTNPSCPHCNANTRSSCWKARRNMKKSPLMNMLTAEEINPEISAAGELAMKHIIRVRESYITYRNGISCDFHNVPCDCACHRSNKSSLEACTQCKAVHDAKKKFNYDPVRKVVLEIIADIQKNYIKKPCAALILFEALLSELCSHRPADFNHITRMPSNPDTRCQCNTPQIMDENIEWELIRIFTLHEIPASLKDNFLKCVNASIQPLQLKDVMKRFMHMRHWSDLLLRAALSGQNTNGKFKNGDILREAPLVVEMRVVKLERENRFQAIVRYLNCVKIFKASKQQTSDGTPITVAIDKWILINMAKRGCFREVCMSLTNTTNLLRTLPNEFILNLLSLLSGKNLPPNTQLLSSFNPKKIPCPYELSGADRTVLLLLFLIFMDVNTKAPLNFHCYLWLAKWVNQEELANDQTMVRSWVQASTGILEMSRHAAAAVNGCSQHLLQCKAVPPQATLFTCSVVVLRFLTKLSVNMAYIPDLIEAYKNNQWALFYLFSQPSLMSCGNHRVISWLTDHLKVSDSSIGQFNQDALLLLIQKNTLADVCLFVKQLIAPNWFNQNICHYVIRIVAKFAVRLINEGFSNNMASADWICSEVFVKIVEKKFFNHEVMLSFCEVIGKACCVINLKHIELHKKIYPPETWPIKAGEIFLMYHQRLSRNLLSPEESALLLHYSIKEGHLQTVKTIFTQYTEKHECSNSGSVSSALMKEVVKTLGTPQHELQIQKREVISLYTKLCSHETLSWLICPKCSAKMPDKWTEVWCTLEDNNFSEDLQQLVQHTLQQFTSWMKDLCVQEENDIKRLLHCLEIFVTNVVKTLIYCKLEQHKLQQMILETRYFIANVQLRNDFLKIIEGVFAMVKQQHAAEKTVPVTAADNNQPVTTLALSSGQRKVVKNIASSSPSTAVSETSQNIATPQNTGPPASQMSPQRTIRSPTSSHKSPHSAASGIRSSPTSKSSHATSSSSVNPNSVIKSPQSADKSPSGLRLTINKHTGSISHSIPANRTSESEILLSPVGLGSPTENVTPKSCPQCGDPMSSSFRCSKCQARKSRDIKCPNCSQINRDLKGYSCRFCYTSLLEVLMTGEAKPAEKPEKAEPPKKSKKLKRKKSENHVSAKEKLQTDERVMKDTAPRPDVEPTPQDTTSQKTTESSQSPARERPRITTVLQKDMQDYFNVKETVRSPEVKRQRAHKTLPTRKISLKDLIPHRPIPHQRTKEVQLQERPHSKTVSPKKDSNIFSNIKRDFHNLSDTSDSSDGETPQKIPPLVLKRRMDHEITRPQETKKARLETPKRCTSQGIAMSKKQKNILQRMKNMGTRRVGNPGKPQKPTPKSPTSTTEWEVTKRRKPGPLSRTSYYTINPYWHIPKHIKIPYKSDLPRICTVHLRMFPPGIMERIHHHQPSLKLNNLYA